MLIALVIGLLAAGGERPAQSGQPAAIPIAAAQQPAPPPQPDGFRFVWTDRPSLRAGSQFRLDFIGKFQWDSRRPGDQPADFSSNEIQRARIGVDGEFLNHFRFNIERELTERELEGDVEGSRRSEAWKDFYLQIDYTDAARVRVGKFKVPFSLDQLTSTSDLDFPYRSLGSSYLAPARDIGVMVSGRFFAEKLTYAGGLFRHDGDNARSRNALGADQTGAFRVTVAPFQRPGESVLDQLEIGTAFTLSALSNEAQLPNGLRGRTLMSRYVFFEPVFVSGRRHRYEIDADWRWERVGARAEFIESRDTRDGQGLLDQDLPSARGRGWYVSGAYVITGEEKNWPVTPRAEVTRGGSGAVEVVGRYERLWFDSAGGTDEPFRHPRAETILPSGDRALTTGVNWYLNRWVRLQLHAVREELEDVERQPRADGAPFWSAIFRVNCVL
jgi:phosphate-selective porin OprO/OprP